jgi:hypothetical protein
LPFVQILNVGLDLYIHKYSSELEQISIYRC